MHDLHIWLDIGEDGRLDEVSLLSVSRATNFDLGTGLLALLNITHDTVILKLGNLWPLECIALEWVANLVLLCAGLESLDKLVINTILDIDTGTCAAALTVVEEDTKVNPSEVSIFNQHLVVEESARFSVTTRDTYEIAFSISASLKTMFGDFPPNSRVTFFKLDPAAAFMICRPTTVDPVKATLSTSMCEERAAPAILPKPEMMLMTPGGNPASFTRFAATRAESGVCSAVFRITVFPQAIAGPIFHAHMSKGKFQGIIWAQTPI